MTLVELLNVLVLIGILLMIAVPSYLGLKDRANQSAAKSDLRDALPAVALYAGDNSPNSRFDPDGVANDEGYQNMTPALLQQQYDPTLDPSKYAIVSTSQTSYCIYTWVDAFTAAKLGPGGQITLSLNSSFNPSTCSGSL